MTVEIGYIHAHWFGRSISKKTVQTKTQMEVIWLETNRKSSSVYHVKLSSQLTEKNIGCWLLSSEPYSANHFVKIWVSNDAGQFN